jgi:hypothetical protein
MAYGMSAFGFPFSIYHFVPVPVASCELCCANKQLLRGHSPPPTVRIPLPSALAACLWRSSGRPPLWVILGSAAWR